MTVKKQNIALKKNNIFLGLKIQKGNFIAKCAESEVFESNFLGQKSIIKKRIPKTYRPTELDTRLKKEHIKSEARLLNKAKQINIKTPLLFFVDLKNFELHMEFINGTQLKNLKWNEFGAQEWKTVGKNIKQLHSIDIIHGDLSTSNIFFTNNKTIAFIDFGLGFISKEIENKAVDLLVLKKTLSSTHSLDFPQNWNAIINGYGNKKILKKISEIEKRARYF